MPAQSFAGWIVQVIRFCILLNGLIPISLYVTIEMVKILQCIWILNSDRKVRVIPCVKPLDEVSPASWLAMAAPRITLDHHPVCF